MLAEFGSLQLTIGYYIDALTMAMFCMVTLVASCIHVYSLGYMHEELHEVTDPLARLERPAAASPRPVLPLLPVPLALLLQHVGAGDRRQPGDGLRLLGAGGHLLVLADRLLHRAEERLQRGQQGVHRQPRGRFRHDHRPDGDLGRHGHVFFRRLSKDATGIFSQVRPRILQPGRHWQARSERTSSTPPCPTAWCAWLHGRNRPRLVTRATFGDPAAGCGGRCGPTSSQWREQGYGYGLLVVAGLGIFCGCVGKSASFRCTSGCPTPWKAPRRSAP